MYSKQVKLQFNCFEVTAGQHVYVTMRTIPNYCGIQLNQEYYVDGKKLYCEEWLSWVAINEKIKIHTDQEIDMFPVLDL